MYYGPASGPAYHPMGCGESLSQRTLRDGGADIDAEAKAMTLAADRLILGADADPWGVAAAGARAASLLFDQASGQRQSTWWDTYGGTVTTAGVIAAGVLAFVMLPAYLNSTRNFIRPR